LDSIVVTTPTRYEVRSDSNSNGGGSGSADNDAGDSGSGGSDGALSLVSGLNTLLLVMLAFALVSTRASRG
jgi:hypothetical protein